MTCAGCGRDLGTPERVGRRDTCPGCGADLHACRNCTFYDPRAYNECHETQAERVLDKTRSNFCEYFSAATPASGARAPRPTATKPAGGSRPTSATSGTREELDRLFRRR